MGLEKFPAQSRHGSLSPAAVTACLSDGPARHRRQITPGNFGLAAVMSEEVTVLVHVELALNTLVLGTWPMATNTPSTGSLEVSLVLRCCAASYLPRRPWSHPEMSSTTIGCDELNFSLARAHPTMIFEARNSFRRCTRYTLLANRKENWLPPWPSRRRLQPRCPCRGKNSHRKWRKWKRHSRSVCARTQGP